PSCASGALSNDVGRAGARPGLSSESSIGIPVTVNRSTSTTHTEEQSLEPASATQPVRPDGAPGAPLSERGAAIVRDEESLLARVTAHLATAAAKPSRPPPTENYEEQLLSLRDQIATARLEDVPALVQQMERL